METMYIIYRGSTEQEWKSGKQITLEPQVPCEVNQTFAFYDCYEEAQKFIDEHPMLVYEYRNGNQRYVEMEYGWIEEVEIEEPGADEVFVDMYEQSAFPDKVELYGETYIHQHDGIYIRDDSDLEVET